VEYHNGIEGSGKGECNTRKNLNFELGEPGPQLEAHASLSYLNNLLLRTDSCNAGRLQMEEAPDIERRLSHARSPLD
jgi:hypothetical protein